MRIVDVAVRQCYRFNCPICGSKLEADCGELVDIGGKRASSGARSAGRSGIFPGVRSENGWCMRISPRNRQAPLWKGGEFYDNSRV